MADKKATLLEVEALLRNGREVFLQLELPRDSVREADGVITYVQVLGPDVEEEHVIRRDDVLYLRQRTIVPGADESGLRTLGRAGTAQPPEPIGQGAPVRSHD
jgi:hypothetical protein